MATTWTNGRGKKKYQGPKGPADPLHKWSAHESCMMNQDGNSVDCMIAFLVSRKQRSGNGME